MPRVPESTWKQLRDDLGKCQGYQPTKVHAKVLHRFRRRHPHAKLQFDGIHLYGDTLEPPKHEHRVETRCRRDHPLYPLFTKGGSEEAQMLLHMPIGKMINFRGADLRNVRFSFNAMHDCDFRGADLRGAMFTGTMKWCFFKGANLQGATFLKGSMIACDARDVCFDEVVFVNYYLKRIRIEGATFDGVILRNLTEVWGHPSLDILPEALAFTAYEKPYSKLSPKCKRYLWKSCGRITREMLEADGDLEEFARVSPRMMSYLDKR